MYWITIAGSLKGTLRWQANDVLFMERSFWAHSVWLLPLEAFKYFDDKVADQQLSFRRTGCGEREYETGRAVLAAFIAI